MVPTALHEALRRAWALRQFVDASQQKLADILTSTKEALEDTHTRKVSDLTDSIERLDGGFKDKVEELKDRIKRGEDQLKWIFGSIAAAVGLIITVGSILGLTKARTLQEMTADVSVLKGELSGLEDLTRRSLLARLVADFGNYLEELNFFLPDRIVLERVKSDAIRIHDLKELLKTHQPSKDKDI